MFKEIYFTLLLGEGIIVPFRQRFFFKLSARPSRRAELDPTLLIYFGYSYSYCGSKQAKVDEGRYAKVDEVRVTLAYFGAEGCQGR